MNVKTPETAEASNQRATGQQSPPCFLHWLNRPGVKVVWKNGKLRLGVKPGALTAEEVVVLLSHKEEVGGWLLLHKLWEAGYSLRLQRSEYGPGYVLMPTGAPTQTVDFPSLFELYDTYHDVAVALLLDACRLLRIDPVDWPKAVERFVKESAQYPDGAKNSNG